MSIQAYDYGKQDGIAEERDRILRWIEEHRNKLELVDGTAIYRDHFDSESLVEFIEKEKHGTR